jgi:hypothetical protein
MKMFKILLVGGIIAIAISSYLLHGASISITDRQTITIPAGESYYYYIYTKSNIEGSISGDYSVVTGTIDFYVLNKAQYQAYHLYLETDQYFFGNKNSSYNYFDVSIPNFDTYYLVMNHGHGSETSDQTVTLHYHWSGTDLYYLIGGFITLIVGIILVVVGWIRKKKELLSIAPTQQNIDVQLFNEQQKPPL